MGRKLFVRNLGTIIDSGTLEDMFSSVGDVEACVVEMDTKSGSPRRVGYVTMTTEEGAKDGIERFNGFNKDGLHLIVTEDLPHVPNPEFKPVKRKAAPPRAKTPGKTGMKPGLKKAAGSSASPSLNSTSKN
ncbi:MAG: RNA-binding protein [Bdellovibrionota bacterium]